MIINVTQEHIDLANAFRRARFLQNRLGEQYIKGIWTSMTCPIALAAGKDSQVDGTHVTINGIDYDLPEEAISFVKAYDMDRPVGPFSFEVTE